MRLEYDGKKSVQEIIEKSKAFHGLEISGDKSLFFHGDNFQALSELISSGFREKIDLIYIDPPFNTNQTFTVEPGRISTVSRKKDSIVAYSDQMTNDQYIEFIRERLILLRELLSEQGSIYLHIDNKMGHYLKIIMDEVFGTENFKNDIARKKSNPKNFKRKAFGNQRDMVLFYAKNKDKNIFNDITVKLDTIDIPSIFMKRDDTGRRYNTVPVHAPGESSGKTGAMWRGVLPPTGRHWRTDPSELDRLDDSGLIEWSKNGVPRLKKFADGHKGKKIQDIWDFIDPAYPTYPTEKNLKMLEMIVAQSSNQDSLVLDCFAGSGSTLIAAQKLGRRWIGVDASNISAQTIQKRLIGHDFDRYDLS